MRETFARILQRWGQTVAVAGPGGSRSVRAFLQPVREREKADPYTMTSLGSVDDRLWTCLAGETLAAGETVERGSERFFVRTAAPVCAGEETIYCWAVLERKREEA